MSQINPPLSVGDRVILLHMEDPYGVRPGTAGTVVDIQKMPFSQEDFNYVMLWDNGRTLAMEPNMDSWVLKSDYDKKKKPTLGESVKNEWEIYTNLLRNRNFH